VDEERPPAGQVAVFIDFENLVLGAGKGLPGQANPVPYAALARLCREYGNASVRRAYADWADPRFGRYQDDLALNGVDLTQVGRFGYRTLAASNAAEGLRIINGPDHIDLLFTDVIIPGGMNGRQLAIEAQKRRPGLKVLYTSGYTENAIVHHGRLDAGVLLLPKPYLSSELARMLRTALAS